MTASGSRQAPTGPGVPARDGVEAPVRPVLDRRGGLRQQAGVIGVALVAIIVVAAGIGLFEDNGADDRGATASGSPGSATAVSATPVTSPGLTGRPVRLPGTACLPVTPGDLPELRLASSDGGEPIGGAAGRSEQVGRSPLTATWPEAAPRLALVLHPSASMVLVTDAPACLRSAVVEYVANGDRGDSPRPTMLLEAVGSGLRPEVDLGNLPEGDWIVRVVAEYDTGGAGQDAGASRNAGAVMERFFRVFAGSGPGASPLIAPVVPCVPLSSGAQPPRLELVADAGEPVLGVDLAVYPDADLHRGAVVAGSFPGRLQLRVVGDACATSWRVEFQEETSRNVLNQNAQENPGENPFLVAQNRIDLPNVNLGHSVVEAIVNFGRDISARAGWDVTISGAPPPTVEAYGSGGAHVTARPGCGVGWTLADGRSAWEACDSPVLPEGMEVLRVRSGRAVRLEITGWTMVSWWVSCGDRSPDGTRYLETGYCNLGGGGDGIRDAGPARFLPLPGRQVVATWISAVRGGDIVGAQYFVEIDALP